MCYMSDDQKVEPVQPNHFILRLNCECKSSSHRKSVNTNGYDKYGTLKLGQEVCKLQNNSLKKPSAKLSVCLLLGMIT